MVWSMSGVVNVLFYTRCGECLVLWLSFFTHGVVDVLCGGFWCGGCPFLHTVWWMSYNPSS